MNSRTTQQAIHSQAQAAENRHVLVIGGSGFLGPSLIAALVKQFPRVSITVFNRGNQNRRIRQLVRQVKGDRSILNDLLQLQAFPFDYVFDLSGVIAETVPYLLQVLGRQIKKYIFISSIAVYPNRSQPIDESASTGFNPVWGEYGTQKYQSENKLIAHWQSKGSLIILRPVYIIGFKDQIYRENRILKRIKEGKTLYVSNQGEERIQFIHKDDLVSICCRLLTVETPNPLEIFNIASPNVYTINTWLQHLAAAYHQRLKLVYLPFEEANRRLFSYLPADITVCSKKIETLVNITHSSHFINQP